MANIDFDEGRRKLQDRIRRFGAHKLRMIAMSEYAAGESMSIARRLDYCHNYLLLHDHYIEDVVRLHRLPEGLNGSCRLHLLCPMCAIIRAANAVGRYRDRYEIIRQAKKSLRLYYVVVTVLNGPDLQERFKHVAGAMRKLIVRRRHAIYAKSGVKSLAYALGSVFANVEGGAYSIEVKRGANSGEWHPHANLLLLSSVPIDKKKLTEEWLEITQDSFITYCEEKPPNDKQIFVEIFKYALKFSEMELEDTWEAYLTLRDRRLMGTFGAFRGVNVPETATCDLESPYIELLYRYGPGGYKLRHSTHIHSIVDEGLATVRQTVNDSSLTINREVY